MIGLSEREKKLLQTFFRGHPEITRIALFGSRALGTNRPNSDIDLVAWGPIDDTLQAHIQAELEELPLPYLFDFVRYNAIVSTTLRHHIDTVAKDIYVATTSAPVD